MKIKLNRHLRIFTVITILLTTFICPSMPVIAQDPATTATATAIGIGLLNASGIVDDILEKAANEGNYVVFNTASQLRLLIESLRLSVKRIVEDGFNGFDNSQQILFENIQKSIINLDIALKQPIEEGRQTVEEIHEVINAGLPWLQESSVLRSTPSVIGPSTLQVIPFVIRGLSLDKANPQLYFGDVKATRIGLEKLEATFTVPAEAIPRNENSPNYLSGRVELSINDCKLFIFFCKEGKTDSHIAVMSLPNKLADVEISYSTKNEKRFYDDKSYVRHFGASTGDLTKQHCEKNTQGPHAPNYFIDTSTITPQDYTVECPYAPVGNPLPKPSPFGGISWQNHMAILFAKSCKDGRMTVPGVTGKAKHSWEIIDRSIAGFTVELCVQSQMHTIVEKRNGEIKVNLVWKEFRMDDDITPQSLFESTKVLNWGQPIAVNLPVDTHAVSVKAVYFDGTSTIFNSNYADKYIDASWNNGSKQLVIRTKKPNQIAGLI